MRICMASDFFYPNTGGVETHIWQLSHHLIELGHEVVVITHAYDNRIGINQISDGLRVHYLPFLLYFGQNIILPLVFNTFAPVRKVLINERIDIVHGHSAFSPMAHQVMFHAKNLGIRTVFTDHSLFGYNEFGAVIHKHIVRLSLLQCNHIICVSHVGKQNKAFKLNRICNNDKDKLINNTNNHHNHYFDFKTIPISVIPNAVDTSMFTPDPSQRNQNHITIVVVSRLVCRKGIDLLAAVLPKICQLDDKIHFIIAGDGPKRSLIENAVEEYQLKNRVQLLGSVPYDQVRNILVKGDIFLNTSRIEAFCMAIVEAASCGLQVVSTNVGGLPEVLPPRLVKLTLPTVDSLVDGVQSALDDLKEDVYVEPMERHRIIDKTFSWMNVAKQTERVYQSVSRDPIYGFKHRINHYYKSNLSFKYPFILLMFIHQLLVIIFDFFGLG